MREYFDARSICCDNGETAQLLYYLICEQSEGCIGYGAEVIMHRGGQRDSALVPNVTTSKIRMSEILTRLCRNTVTPCTLHEMIAEELHKF